MARRTQAAFALPSILIASIVMLIVLSFTLSSVATTRVALDDQYYNRLAQEAAESGIEAAKACLTSEEVWPEPLRFGSDCNGLSDADCSTDGCYLIKEDSVRTGYRVSIVISDSKAMVRSEGQAELLRKSNSEIWKTYSQALSMELPINHDFQHASVSGASHGCAIAPSNKAYCWGNGSDGRLGNGSTVDSVSSVPVKWGAMPNGTTVLQVSAGGSHSCAMTSDSKAYCWGGGSDGRLGNGSTSSSTTPVAVQQGEIPNGVTLQQISAGSFHTCAIASNDKAYCWGSAAYGRLGNGSTSGNVTTPVAVQQGEIPNGVTLQQISAGNPSSCAIASNDKAYCWGSAAYGRLGNGSTSGNVTTPVAVQQGEIPNGVTLQQISPGHNHTCAVASNGKAYCWGQGSTGRLGNGSTSSSTTPVAVQQGEIPNGATILQVSASNNHTCAVASNGKAYCWGAGSTSKLGNGSTSSSTTPVAVQQGEIPNGATILQVFGGNTHTCAIASNNKIYCWGTGSIVNGSIGGSTTPVAIDIYSIKVSDSMSIY